MARWAYIGDETADISLLARAIVAHPIRRLAVGVRLRVSVKCSVMIGKPVANIAEGKTERRPILRT